MVEHGENAHNTQMEELDLMEINRMLLMGEEEVITRTTTPIRTFGEATNEHNSLEPRRWTKSVKLNSQTV